MEQRIITQEMLTAVDGDQYVTEASDIGLVAGKWPTQLPTSIGNGNPLLRMHAEYNAEHELVAVNYRQAWGNLTVRVLND
jgi:hypothetical protein